MKSIRIRFGSLSLSSILNSLFSSPFSPKALCLAFDKNAERKFPISPFLSLSSIIVILLLCQSCIPGLYKFTGTSFDPNIETFYVSPFETRTGNAPPTIGITFEEGLKLKIRRESKLSENDTNPNIEFKGTITRFDVQPQAPEAGETIGFNRLTIAIEIEYIDYFHDDDLYNWKQTFSRFADFGANDNLLNVQDALIDEISQQILEDIFNKAFTDW